MSIRYVHTNIVARDWRKLADFYIEVFGCQPIPPERDLAGDWIERMTGINQVRIRGAHLSLPGYKDGPTLEIFQFDPACSRSGEPRINRQGYGHLAFHVDSVDDILNKLISHGGEALGEIIRKEYEGLGQLTAVYALDPEGNFIEIQNWS